MPLLWVCHCPGWILENSLYIFMLSWYLDSWEKLANTSYINSEKFFSTHEDEKNKIPSNKD